MARKSTKKKADKPDSKPANGSGIGHNSELTEDQRQALSLSWLRQFEPSLTAKNKAASDHSNLCKRMKTEITWVDDPTKLMKEMIDARTPEGAAKIKAALERKLAAARYMATPLGEQVTMTDEELMPATDRAFAEGKRDAMSGDPLRNPYDPSVPQNNSYAEGWHAGQKALADAQRARDAEIFDGAGKESPEEAAALADVEAAGIGGAAASFEVRH